MWRILGVGSSGSWLEGHWPDFPLFLPQLFPNPPHPQQRNILLEGQTPIKCPSQARGFVPTRKQPSRSPSIFMTPHPCSLPVLRPVTSPEDTVNRKINRETRQCGDRLAGVAHMPHQDGGGGCLAAGTQTGRQNEVKYSGK